MTVAEMVRPTKDSKAAMKIERIGVIGAGQMGNGIAHVCALAGYDVMLEDINRDALDKARKTIEKNLLRQVSRGLIKDKDAEAALARIRTTLSIDDLKDRDLVIEAATENETVKRKIFQDLCKHLKKDAMIASNTSSISITRLAASTDRPERFIGLHFMNPVPVMELVEVIRGIATQDETFSATHGAGEAPRQKSGECRRFPRLHRQSHFAAYDQRGGLHAL